MFGRDEITADERPFEGFTLDKDYRDPPPYEERPARQSKHSKPTQEPSRPGSFILNVPGASTRHESQQLKLDNLPNALKWNLFAAKITIFLMFIVAIINFAFANVMRSDLKGDSDHFTCEYNYIKDAAEAPPGMIQASDSPARYGRQCDLLYTWTSIYFAAGTLTIFRAFMQILPTSRENPWAKVLKIYRQDSIIDRLFSPQVVYGMRTATSGLTCAVYLVCVVILGTSRLITGPKAEDSYRNMYEVCLALLTVSLAVTAQQGFATGWAAWALRERD